MADLNCRRATFAEAMTSNHDELVDRYVAFLAMRLGILTLLADIQSEFWIRHIFADDFLAAETAAQGGICRLRQENKAN